MQSVLILDDDITQLNYLANLLNEDFLVQTVSNPISAYKMFSQNEFDAVIVDVHMPILNGLDFIKNIQTKLVFSSSLFILSSDTSMQTKLQALALGVKDFLWPEMQKEEIILRIKNHLQTSTIRSYKNLKIDLQNFSAFLSGNKLELTLIEFKILSILASGEGEVVSRKKLIEFTWPDIQVMDKTLNTHLTNLRAKLSGSNLEIKSLKGEGILLV
jgi:DNA-binding response OmpR family regulator